MSARWRRYFHLLDLAIRLLRLRFLRKTDDRDLAREVIAQRLGETGGIAMKIGQVVADVGQAPEMRKLLAGARARPLSEMRPVLEQELDGRTDCIFASISEQASAASLGQVHRAELRGGDTVAIKIQYPYVESAVRTELKLAGLMPGLGPVKKWGIDLDAYRRALADNMERELDYVSESERQNRMRDALRVDGLVVPAVYAEYCTRRLLVQQWETGRLLDEILEWPLPDRMLIGRTLLLTLFKSVFEIGEVHGDPHMGNTFYRHAPDGKPQVVLLDFGCTIPIGRLARLALLKLINVTRDKTASTDEVLSGFVALGFEAGKLIHIADQLPLLAQILFKPFMLDEPFDTRAWRIKAGFEQLLGENRWWFRSAGPADLFLIMRAFQGVVRQLERLDVRLPWWPLLEKAVAEEIITEARRLDFPALPGDIRARAGHLQPVSTSLKVKIEYADDRPPIELSLPALAALEIEEVMPADILAMIEQADDIDFPAIKRELVASRLSPGDLFSLAKPGVVYRVWLE